MQQAEELIQKFSNLKKARLPWEHDWQDISRVILPRREDWSEVANRAERIGTNIYDGTAMGAASILANGFTGYVLSPNVPWFRLSTEDPDMIDGVPGAREWLEHVEKIMYGEFRRSNLYEQAIEFFRDGSTIATATMYIEESRRNGRLRFSTRHPKEIFIAENDEGDVDTVFRRFHMTARAMAQKFGYEALSDVAKNMAENSPYETIPVIHGVYPREDRDVTKRNAKNKRYASSYLEEDGKNILRESGYEQIPYFTWRWTVNTDELYGRGPGHEVLSEVKKLNLMSKGMLRLTQMATDPPLNVPEEMRNRLQWSPGGRNYYNQPEMLVQPAQVASDFPVGFDREERIRQTIESAYMTDFFLMLQRAPDRMTATEVMERQAEKAAIMGPILGRLTTEFLNPLIKRSFSMLLRQRKVPPPPRALVEMIGRGGELKIEYLGPLAESQKKFHTTKGIDQALVALQPIAQYDPMALDNIDWDEVTRQSLEGHGMPQRALRDREQVEQIRQARNQAQQQQQQMENAEKMGKAAEGLNQKKEPDSLIDMLNNAANRAPASGGDQ